MSDRAPAGLGCLPYLRDHALRQFCRPPPGAGASLAVRAPAGERSAVVVFACARSVLGCFVVACGGGRPRLVQVTAVAQSGAHSVCDGLSARPSHHLWLGCGSALEGLAVSFSSLECFCGVVCKYDAFVPPRFPTNQPRQQQGRVVTEGSKHVSSHIALPNPFSPPPHKLSQEPKATHPLSHKAASRSGNWCSVGDALPLAE
eukprot:COSAG04_NODE_1317_length_7248_cov_10.699119_4_plen_202_part_00